MRSVDRLLTVHPEWKDRFVFVQVAAPTRSKLSTYLALQSEAQTLAEEINAKHADAAYQPIVPIVQHFEPEQVYELFKAADTVRTLLSAITGDPILCILMAAALTWAAHSSVATVLLIMSLAYSNFVTPAAASRWCSEPI